MGDLFFWDGQIKHRKINPLWLWDCNAELNFGQYKAKNKLTNHSMDLQVSTFIDLNNSLTTLEGLFITAGLTAWFFFMYYGFSAEQQLGKFLGNVSFLNILFFMVIATCLS